MISTQSKWGLFPWFEEHGVEIVHPDDLDRIRLLVPYGKVFQCTESDGQWTTLRYGLDTFRVKSNIITSVPEPAKKIGDEVLIRQAEKVLSGVVCDVLWHFQKSQPYFHVSVAGGKLKKRYWLEDFLDES